MMGSTLEFRTGFAHGRRKKALAGGISRSPAAKRVAIICKIRRPKKKRSREKGEEERAARNGDGPTKGEGIYVDSTGKGTRLTILAGSNSSEGIGFEGMATISLFR
jgi:hypothetical protein